MCLGGVDGVRGAGEIEAIFPCWSSGQLMDEWEMVGEGNWGRGVTARGDVGGEGRWAAGKNGGACRRLLKMEGGGKRWTSGTRGRDDADACGGVCMDESRVE